MMIIFQGMVLGVLSSLHCLGMCGPLAMSVPMAGQDKHPIQSWLRILMYHLGRITSYVTLGIIAGLIGRGFYLTGYHQYISILLGVTILLILILGKSNTFLNVHFDRLSHFVRQKISFVLGRPGRGAVYLFGILNGLLPCGMVYMALVMTLPFYNLTSSVLLMAGFGLGTVPALFGLQWVGKKWGRFINVRRAFPWVMGITGVLLIIRGLNLDIAYLSPKLDPLVNIMCGSGF
ncbi:sulfite exporter TauE/SafE family protein [Membranihabitans maritimus]|uniref:sulfite exporter TauE/SafE family protein n=1 Tax=Membranihabitans maritimus TaxID=2904244 RepID=UPI001F238CE7|nr:sulfite exporter TauE/SafE family protein [Membranihabitans maritimus]